jgi:AAA+ ATPase superfamily predicted ATPase
MKNVIGTPARGDSFFPREREVRKIISRLKNGNNLNLAAPRRVGKTSILYYLLDNKEADYVYVYVDTEAVSNEQDFFKKILKEIIKVEDIGNSGKLKKLFEGGHKFLGRIKGLKFMGYGIDLADTDTAVDYKEDVIHLLSGIELENDKKIVILIDEFPQTIINIVESNGGSLAQAKQFLQSNRELRMNPEINKRVRFILTGSIGLNHTVVSIDASAFINDLNSVEMEPLSQEEADEFLGRLLSSQGLSIQSESLKYILKIIEWLIPFHIQLVVQEIGNIASKGVEITNGLVDKAFENIIQIRNSNHFEHYSSRLRKQFKNPDLPFVLEVLDKLAKDGVIKKAVVFDLSVKHGLEGKWRHVLEVLVYDGYINNTGDVETYRFNSPLVRLWWKNFICKL